MTGSDPSHGDTGNDPAGARLLFRYVGGEEWHEYRAILGVFAGTFFAEFTPDDVAAEVAGGTAEIDPAVVPDRLESLRRWGNLTVSSSIGNPSSLDDYYRRRNRYLITRAGQEVYELVERVLAGADEIGDVQAGRLRDLHRALERLGAHGEAGFDRAGSDDLADTVRTVFDLHERFTTELTQFFAELNEWQSRYDLDADEVRFSRASSSTTCPNNSPRSSGWRGRSHAAWIGFCRSWQSCSRRCGRVWRRASTTPGSPAA